MARRYRKFQEYRKLMRMQKDSLEHLENRKRLERAEKQSFARQYFGAELSASQELSDLLKADDLRKKALESDFNPITGKGSIGFRVRFRVAEFGEEWWIPKPMMTENKFVRILSKLGSARQFCLLYDISGDEKTVLLELVRLRCRYDFPFFAAQFVNIKAKVGGKPIHFVLNYPQRKLCSVFEQMRLEEKPIKVIVLKARQWGGSTLTQIYMAWIQLFHKESWYSAIVAHQSGAALKIKAMYDKMVQALPPSLIGMKDKTPLRLTPYSGSRTDYTITQGKQRLERDTVISIGSMQSPDSVRAGDVSMVHYSEVGLYRTTEGKTPEDLIQAISASVPEMPYAMNVMESTAKGENNLFHHEWLDAKNGISGRVPVFIPWYEIEMYRRPFESEKERADFAARLVRYQNQNIAGSRREEPGSYLWGLLLKGATLEAVNWYVNKRREFQTHDTMASEFPSDDIEAFAHSGQKIFDKYKVEQLRFGCCAPKWRGEIRGEDIVGFQALRNIHFEEDTQGDFMVWSKPDTTFRARDRYVVSVDVGGRSAKADFSVIVVIDRWWRTQGEGDEIVAEWYGHCPHDQLAWKMVQIATWYNNALLVPEANTFESDYNRTEGDHTQYILDTIGGIYRNMYTRQAAPSKTKQGKAREWGFFTNGPMKELIIDNLKALIDNHEYTEREEKALWEYNTYQRDERGKANAAEGYHDDRVMARAIGLYVSSTMPLPKEVRAGSASEAAPDSSVVNESFF